jgi:hypothetical protein
MVSQLRTSFPGWASSLTDGLHLEPCLLQIARAFPYKHDLGVQAFPSCIRNRDFFSVFNPFAISQRRLKSLVSLFKLGISLGDGLKKYTFFASAPSDFDSGGLN